MAVIWHNPRCSKSRATLALLEAKGLTPEVRLYLKDPPSREEILAVLAALGRSAASILRKTEAAFGEAGLTQDSTGDEIVAAMAAHPVLIERPIVIDGTRAAVGRPPEAVLDLF